MEHIYAVETAEELSRCQSLVRPILPAMDGYIRFLQREYAVVELPRAVVWTSQKIATQLVSDIPVPAYTNEYRVMMCPDPAVWRSIYCRQLEPFQGSPDSAALCESICAYYTTELSQRHILQILGHELAHHSKLFAEDFDSYGANGVWFEEGMVEYISRRYFLSAEEFERQAAVNRQLVHLFQRQYGWHSLEEFGKATYAGNYASIFYEYWRSFLAVQTIAEAHGGDVHAVFRSYREWAAHDCGQTLAGWFQISI